MAKERIAWEINLRQNKNTEHFSGTRCGLVKIKKKTPQN